MNPTRDRIEGAFEKTLSVKQFETETHLAIATSGTGHGIVEKTLEAKKIRRAVAPKLSILSRRRLGRDSLTPVKMLDGCQPDSLMLRR